MGGEGHPLVSCQVGLCGEPWAPLSHARQKLPQPWSLWLWGVGHTQLHSEAGGWGTQLGIPPQSLDCFGLCCGPGPPRAPADTEGPPWCAEGPWGSAQGWLPSWKDRAADWRSLVTHEASSCSVLPPRARCFQEQEGRRRSAVKSRQGGVEGGHGRQGGRRD